MKDFKGEIDVILGESKTKRGRPSTQSKEITKSSEQGTKAGETRATFIVNQSNLDDIKAIAFYERVMIKDAIESALTLFIKDYQRKNGMNYLQAKKPKL